MADADLHHRARGLDGVAVNTMLSRLAHAPEAPWLHSEVARRMVQRLDIIRLKPALILDWWGFGGASAAVLQHACPNARRVAIEPTPALLERSLRTPRPSWWSALRRGQADVGALLATAELPPGAQMVWANMMLHAAPEPPALIARWQRALSVDGFVMFSALGPGTLRELRGVYRRLGWGPPTQDFVDMHDLGDMLVQAGFADPVMDQEVLSLRWGNPLDVLADLRKLGGNTAPARHAGLRTPGWRQHLLAELEALRASDGKIALSFEVAYGHAFKAAPRARVGENTTVSLEAMRSMVRSGRPPL